MTKTPKIIQTKAKRRTTIASVITMNMKMMMTHKQKQKTNKQRIKPVLFAVGDGRLGVVVLRAAAAAGSIAATAAAGKGIVAIVIIITVIISNINSGTWSTINIRVYSNNDNSIAGN